MVISNLKAIYIPGNRGTLNFAGKVRELFAYSKAIFIATALLADAFYKLICPYVCLLTFEVPFKRLLAPLPEIGCPNILEIQSPWGKVMERSVLRFKNFY